MNIHVLTRCTRLGNLPFVENSIVYQSRTVNVNWKITVDISAVDVIDTSVLKKLKTSYSIRFWEGTKGDMGHSFLNRLINEIHSDDWIYVLDDDNTMWPNFLKEIEQVIEDNRKAEVIVFSQYVGGKDFSGLEIREASPENVKVSKIDMAQYVFKKSVVGSTEFKWLSYTADGSFAEELYNNHPDKFVFIDKVMCSYNSLQVIEKSYTLPRILVMGSNDELKTFKNLYYESDDLNTIVADNIDAVEKIIKYDPDCILTVGEDHGKFGLGDLSPDFRLRWIHLKDTVDKLSSGESAYNCAMLYALKSSTENALVSIFTPMYNTGTVLFRTYSSVREQNYRNWEWVLVNDSNDPETLAIARQIASGDPRVKIFDFAEKSKGVIGEVKYRACVMTKGKYLIELDHDDFLLPHALSRTVEAFEKFEDAGFVYSNCAEIDNNHVSLTYGETFAFGYGHYKEEFHNGRFYKVASTPNINPVTIRHIVSSPNHLRAWRRETYFRAGCHNRRLSIADDYELIVRTFLVTKFVKIDQGCYLQFHHGKNSQNATRADIQRRVRTIANFYNNKIKERFEELGKEDSTADEENFVNYVLE